MVPECSERHGASRMRSHLSVLSQPGQRALQERDVGSPSSLSSLTEER